MHPHHLCTCGLRLAGGLAVLALAACASADVAPISGMPHDRIGQVSVSEVTVAIETPKPNPGLKANLENELRSAVAVCAKGGAPHRMDVTVIDFEEQDVGKAIFIGDEIELAGRVVLTEAATGTRVGEYYVKRSFFWGGFIGAAMMSDAEESLSKEFAQSVCEEIFNSPLPDAGKTAS